MVGEPDYPILRLLFDGYLNQEELKRLLSE